MNNTTHTNKEGNMETYDSILANCTDVVKGYRSDFIKTDCRWSKTTSRHISTWLAGATAKKVPQSVLDGING